MNGLKNRGIQDILLAAADGPTGFTEAITAVFPKTEALLCIVHMILNSVRFVPYTDSKAMTAGLKTIYLAPSADLAAEALEAFADVWDKKYPMISKSWRNRWNEIIPFFKFSPEIRKAVYIHDRGGNYTIQKVIKYRQSFPNNDAAMKLIFMGLKIIARKWTMPIGACGAALNQFAVIYRKTGLPCDHPFTHSFGAVDKVKNKKNNNEAGKAYDGTKEQAAVYGNDRDAGSEPSRAFSTKNK